MAAAARGGGGGEQARAARAQAARHWCVVDLEYGGWCDPAVVVADINVHMSWNDWGYAARNAFPWSDAHRRWAREFFAAQLAAEVAGAGGTPPAAAAAAAVAADVAQLPARAEAWEAFLVANFALTKLRQALEEAERQPGRSPAAPASARAPAAGAPAAVDAGGPAWARKVSLAESFRKYARAAGVLGSAARGTGGGGGARKTRRAGAPRRQHVAKAGAKPGDCECCAECKPQ